MAEPANWTLTPLKTPLLVLPTALPLPVFPTAVWPSTPSVAELGPEVMFVEILRSNWPAEARCRLAIFSFGCRRATSISRLFSRASAIASCSER